MFVGCVTVGKVILVRIIEAFGRVLIVYTLRKLCFHFLSNLMGYDRGDSFPFDF